MSSLKNGEMSFLIIKTSLVSVTAIEIIFYDNRTITEKCRFWSILAKMGTPKNGKMSFVIIKSC